MQWGALAGLGSIAAVTAVVASSPQSVRYPVPVAVARERLAAAPLPDALRVHGGGQVALVREDGALTWRLGPLESRSTGRVTLKRAGASTDVTVDFDLADNAFPGSRLAGTALTRSMARTMFAEHVAAVLGGRAFDPMRAMSLTARELQANPEMLKEYGEAIGQQYNDVAAMLEADLRPPADTPYAGTPASQRAATRPDPDSYRPMTDVSR